MNACNEEGRKWSRWVLLAVSAPLAEYAGAGCLPVLLAAGAMLPLAGLTGDGFSHLGKAEYILEWIWTGLVLGSLLPAAGAYWPGEKSEIVVPLTLLALVICSAGQEKGLRIGNTLFWLVSVPAALILFGVTGRVELKELVPVQGDWTPELLVALLVPALGAWGPSSGREKGKTLLLTGLAAGTLAALIQGGLGGETAKTQDAPLYELGRCVGNGGFEILVSIIMTLGWYSLASLVISRGRSFAETCGIGTKMGLVVPIVLCAGMILTGMRLSGAVLTAGGLILWILIPMLRRKIK